MQFLVWEVFLQYGSEKMVPLQIVDMYFVVLDVLFQHKVYHSNCLPRGNLIRR
jgi:hypothetical protein